MYDVIIIGKGPAGISASLYAKRGNLHTLVIGKDSGVLSTAHWVENYYGTSGKISGEELVQKGIRQAESIGVEIKTEEVLHIDYEGTFNVVTQKNTYSSKTIILATGAKRNVPQIAGVKEYEGKGVSYCAICDAFFYRGKDIAVLGNGDYAVHEAMQLLPIAKSVTMLTNGKEPILTRTANMKTNTKPIREFRGDTTLQSVTFEDDSNLPVSGVFIAEGTASSTDLARKLGIQIQGNTIVVNEKMETNIPGFYAAGDCTGGILQIAKAVYEGAKAGMEVIGYVRKDGK